MLHLYGLNFKPKNGNIKDLGDSFSNFYDLPLVINFERFYKGNILDFKSDLRVKETDWAIRKRLRKREDRMCPKKYIFGFFSWNDLQIR